MNTNQKISLAEKISPAEVLDIKRQQTQAVEPQRHNQKKTDNPMVVGDSKARPAPDWSTMTRGQKTNTTLAVDSKVQPKPSMGSPPHDQKIISTAVEDIKVQPKPTLGHCLLEQKIGPVGADSEAQPLAHNFRANKSITQTHKKVRRPLSGKHGFKSFICWTIGLIFFLLLIMGGIAAIIYLVFRPKIPNYSVDSLSISDLMLNLDLSLYAKFNVKITATNPNKKIGIYYRRGSKLSVWYSKTKLCQGSLPNFYQGHQNTTNLDVALTGQNQYGSTLMAALQEQQQTGRIPLDLKVDVPVNIKLGKLKLRKIRILGTCLLTVDSLSANSFITIKASTCKFRAKL